MNDLPPGWDRHRVARFRRRLLDWFRRHQRDLPWRRTTDPYAVHVAEVMLQQTTVAAALPYYRRFMERFPTPGALASAREETVLGLWSGLGYYRRARNLQAAVLEVTAHRQGRYPETADGMRRLPGVGEYTAAAVASIAFDRPDAVVDGNVTRLLSRIFTLQGKARSGRLQRECLALARVLLAPRSPGEFNQAMMEAGATVCTPRDPDCDRCPASRDCAGRETPERYPAPSKRRTPIAVRRAAALIREQGRVLLVKVSPGQPNAGMLEPPSVEVAPSVDAVEALVTGLEQGFGLRIEVQKPLGQVRHTITHRRITLELYGARRRGRGPLRAPLRLVPESRLEEMALSSAGRKVLAAL